MTAGNRTGSTYKILLWGAGVQGREFLDKLEKNKELYRDYVLGIVDNDPNKAGYTIKGKNIYTACEVCGMDFDYIIITTKYYLEVKEQIVSKWNVDEYKIFLQVEYEKFCYARQVYNNYYCGIELRREKPIKVPVVYTAITGDYDELHDPTYIDHNIEYVCFTNNKKIKSSIWRIVYVENEGLSDVLLARKIKLFPHKYLNGRASSIWVDGKLQIIGDLQELVNTYCNSSPIFCFSHFLRNCIYDEAVACLTNNKISKQEIMPQICSYYQEGYPFDAGLYETGFIYREHNEKVMCLMDAWWNEILKFTYRDQISLPYVVKKIGLKPDIADLYVYKNKYLKFYEHMKIA